MNELSQAVRGVNGLITNFVHSVPGVAHAVVISPDGLPLGYSEQFPKDRLNEVAVVAGGLVRLTQDASRIFEAGAVTKTVVEMQRGVLLLMPINEGSCLAVLAASDCDMGLVLSRMTMMVESAREVLTPAVRAELQASEPR